MVDESGSMGSKQKALISRLQEISQGVEAHLDYRLGLIGFAFGSHKQHSEIRAPLSSDMTDFYAGLEELSVAQGSSANSYDAVITGTGEDLGFRDVSAKCGVLISDAPVSEAPAGFPASTKEKALSALESRGMILFSVTANDANTLDAYGPGDGLAGQSGGEWWNVNLFTNDASSVLDALITKCVIKATTPDLSVSKDGPNDKKAPGESVEYTISVANEAVIDVSGIDLVDTLPPGTELQKQPQAPPALTQMRH